MTRVVLTEGGLINPLSIYGGGPSAGGAMPPSEKAFLDKLRLQEESSEFSLSHDDDLPVVGNNSESEEEEDEAEEEIRRRRKEEERRRQKEFHASLRDQRFNRAEYGTVAEQEDETDYDDRSDCEDDLRKGKIKFPSRLYGRDDELAALRDAYEGCLNGNGDNSGEDDSSSRVVFLGGFSGTGKSTLVKEFARRIAAGEAVAEPQPPPTGTAPSNGKRHFGKPVRPQQHHQRQKERSLLRVCSGKFSEIKASNPFSAISYAMQDLVAKLLLTTTQPENDAELRQLRARLASQADIRSDYHGCHETRTLVDRMPPLAPLLVPDFDGGFGGMPQLRKHTSSAMIGQDLTSFKYIFCKFLRALCTQQRPILLFIDDLQWADAASIELLTSICKDPSIKYFVFVGAYVTTEVHEEHPFAKLMETVRQVRNNGKDGSTQTPGCVLDIELTNLSPKHVQQFVADSLGRSDDAVDEVFAISSVVYGKTLGNIFFVMQALEELVRRNVLYYDVMTFRWEWSDVERANLEEYLPDDVVEVVRSKIAGLPPELQKTLTAMAFASPTLDLLTLQALVKSDGLDVDAKELTKLLDIAVAEGVYVTAGTNQVYSFVHDHIQEAARSLVPPGPERDALLVRLSLALADRGMKVGGDCMLFVAVHHLNAVPRRCVTDKAKPKYLAQLNYHVATLAASKGLFSKTSELARAAVSYLDPTTCWQDDDQYQACLDLYDLLMETEHSLGNYDQALAAVDQVLEHARTTKDKATAHHTRIATICDRSEKNYELGMTMGLEALKLYGIELSAAPTKKDLLCEQLRLRMALRNRPLMILTCLPVSEDDSIMRLLQLTSLYANLTKNHRVVKLIAFRAIRLALREGCITKYLPCIVSSMGLPLRGKEKYKEGYAYANVATSLLDHFPDEKGKGQVTKVMVFLNSAILLLRRPFGDCVGDFMDFHEILIANGMPDVGLISARLSACCFFAAGLPLNCILEPKLQVYQDLAVSMGQKDLVVQFKALRQFLYNLQGRNNKGRPALLMGDAFDEETMVVAMKDDALSMMISTLRLQLAFIYDDETAMEEMLERLEPYPIFDMPIVRQYLRLAYIGFAGLTLGKRKDLGKEKKKKYLDMGVTAMNYFRKQVKFGSPNAQPIYACLKAMHRPTKAHFDSAIRVCSDATLMNLTAIMNERCAHFIEGHQKDVQVIQEYLNMQEYLNNAYWLYNDWGAKGKVNQLRKQHEFLRTATRSAPPSMLSSILKSTNMKDLTSSFECTASLSSNGLTALTVDGSISSMDN